MEAINTPALANPSVQNGTTIIAPQVTVYVDKFRSYVRKTAESVIGLAVTITEAEENLSPKNFELFCDEIQVKKGKGFYKKLKTIGKAAQRLQVVKDVLPNSWTTVYTLAKLDSDQFDQVSGANILTPTVTAREINEFLGIETKKSPAITTTPSQANVVSVDLNGLDKNSRSIVAGLLVNIANTYKCQVTLPDTVNSNSALAA